MYPDTPLEYPGQVTRSNEDNRHIRDGRKRVDNDIGVSRREPLAPKVLQMATESDPERGSWFRSPTTLALVGFLAIAAFFLLTEHTAHVFGALPFLLILTCPLMHLFMRGGHGGHHQGGER